MKCHAQTASDFSFLPISGMITYESEITAIKELYNATNGQYWMKQWDYAAIDNCSSNSNCSACSLNLYGVYCDNKNKILELQLQNNNLNGTIPESIANLKDITILYLYNNHLTGSIPRSIFSLKNLQQLALHQNEIHDSIPTTIGNLTSLMNLSLFSNDINGSIPDAIGKLQNLQELDLSRNNLTGPIPESVCSLTKLAYLALNSNNLNGTISDAISNLTNLEFLSIFENSLHGTICKQIGNLASLTELHLWGNNLSGTIPDSIGNLSNLTIFCAGYNNLSGSIPSSIGRLVKLQHVKLEINSLSGTIPEMKNLKQLVNITLNENQLNGTIPHSIWSLPHLSMVSLGSNQLTGTISPLIANLTNSLICFDVSNNKLHGIIPDSIGNLTNLQSLILNDNQLESNNISSLLSNLLFCDQCSNLKVLSIANNVDITGNLSKIKTNSSTIATVQQTSLEYFVASKCDLYGSLPHNIEFTNIKEFVIYNNRLSCALPDNLITTNNDNGLNMTIVLPSNLFKKSKSNKFPNWMDVSMFKSVESFYISPSDETISILIAIIAGLCMSFIIVAQGFLIVNQCRSHSDHQKNATTSTSSISDSSLLKVRMRVRKETFMLLSQDVFVNNLKTAMIQFMKLSLMICLLVLIGIYYFNSKYFQCSLMLDQLSLNYYYTNNDNWMDWIVIITLTMLYCILCSNVTQLYDYQVKQYDRLSHLEYESINQDNGLTTVNDTKAKITRTLSFLILLILFLVANVFVVVSIIVDNLPSHNILRINALQVSSISIPLPLALSINTAVIIPKFVDSCHKFIYLKRDHLSTIYVTKYRSLIILLLRSVSMIIVPMISSVFLIQNCGNYWVKFWHECNSNRRNQFDVAFSYLFSPDANIAETLEMTLLDSSKICNPTQLSDIQWDKCIRTFSSQWSLVVTKKMAVMILLPFFVIVKKFLTLKLMRSVKNLWTRVNICNCKKSTKSSDQNNNNDSDDDQETFVGLKIDLEYANLLTMLESMIIWCPISPLIVPLTVLSIYSNYFAYHHAILKYHWSVYPFDNDVKLPIHALCISIIFSQTYVCFFMFFCFEHEYTGWVFAIVMFCVDVLFLLKYWWSKRRVKHRFVRYDT